MSGHDISVADILCQEFFVRRDELDDYRLLGSYPETGFGEIDGNLLEADFWPGIISGS